MTTDAVARAYAILGLKRGCTPREVKQQYKALVRKWHPDRYANDPVGSVEATAELRRINEAFKTLEAALREPVETYRRAPTSAPQPAASPAPERDPPTWSGRPLTAAEIDRLARAIGRPDPIGIAFDFASWFAPLLIGLALLIYGTREGRSRGDVAMGLTMLALAIVLAVRLLRRRHKRVS